VCDPDSDHHKEAMGATPRRVLIIGSVSALCLPP
jgi:hypothetical protein